jgi:hypothetical protein
MLSPRFGADMVGASTPIVSFNAGMLLGKGTVIVGLGWCLVRHATLFVEEFEPLFLCWVITRSCPERIMIN